MGDTENITSLRCERQGATRWQHNIEQATTIHKGAVAAAH